MGDDNNKPSDQAQGPPATMTMEQYQAGGGQPVQVSMAISQSQATLPNLAPTPQHTMAMGHPGQIQQSPAGQPMQMQPAQAMGQPMTMGQPQYQVVQPYSQFPQYAQVNPQGQLVFQPAAANFIGQPGQPGQIMVLPQPQPGKPNMVVTQPSTPGKPPGQPQYTITSTGLQLAPGQPGQPQQTFIMAPQMVQQSPMPGQVSMPGPQPGQPGNMTPMQGKDGKPVMTGPPQPMQLQQNPAVPQQVLLQNGQMAYMQPQQLQNGQIIFRPAAPGDQQIMFSSPSGPPTAPPQTPTPQTIPATTPMPSPMTMPPARPNGMPGSGPPPGKTAISRAIAPLLPTVSQSGPRMGFPGPAANTPNQPSPKSKQKMSPRGGNIGPGRPPGPKSLNTAKMMPKMPTAPTDLLAGAKPPQLQSEAGGPPLTGAGGPPTLTPMMMPVVSGVSGPPSSIMPTPQSMIVSMPSVPVKPPVYQMTTTLPTVSTVTPIQSQTLLSDSGPPMLTKEINPPMPNLGPPNLSGPGSMITPAPVLKTPISIAPGTTQSPADANQTSSAQPTPKAVVKPNQVLTHIIDGHIIKESSTPFPVSPSKTPVRRKSEKEEKQTPPPNTTAPVKRGPGRPPGSNNKNNQNQDKLKQTGVTGEPPVKKLKDDPKESVPPLVQGAPLTPQNKPKDPAPSLLGSPKNNPLKWNVQQVCDFIKNLPGCSDYVEDFAVQEIDGQALMLLQADHLMTAMSIKLGPALKICEQVKVLKDEMAKN